MNLFEKFTETVEDHPLISAIAAIGTVIVVYFIIQQNRTTASGAASGIPTPQFVQPVSENITNNPGNPTANPTTQTMHIRQAQTTGIDAGWDKTHAGVPLHSQPSAASATIMLLPFGSTVTVYTQAVTGGYNQTGGSNQWYPVTGGGYVSAWDVTP